MYASSIVFAIAATGALASPAISKRDVKCSLTNYPSLTLGPLQDAKAYLNKAISDPVTAAGGSCTLVTCSYGTGVSLCADVDQQKTKGDILTDLNDATGACGVPDQGGNKQFPAFQNFKDGYNILVKGGFSC